MKIAQDIILASLGLLLSLPFLLIAVILITIIDWQNPIFLQQRVGYRKRNFVIIKLRTMKNDSVTVLGRVLRITGIDELPQLLNILLLDMSFVGPRPLTTFDVERLGWGTNYYNIRWEVRPGLVGLAQLSNVCSARLSWFFDKAYVMKRTFLLDAKIIASSAIIPFVGKKRLRNWVQSK